MGVGGAALAEAESRARLAPGLITLRGAYRHRPAEKINSVWIATRFHGHAGAPKSTTARVPEPPCGQPVHQRGRNHQGRIDCRREQAQLLVDRTDVAAEATIRMYRTGLPSLISRPSGTLAWISSRWQSRKNLASSM